jgi:hypothetical protein
MEEEEKLQGEALWLGVGAKKLDLGRGSGGWGQKEAI